MTNERPGLQAFLSDIAPFFYRRRLTYVDVGAYNGETFAKVLASGLQIGEAHLFEPNPASLAAARARIGDSFKGYSVDFYNLAVGAQPGRVRLHAAKTMTRVVDAEADPEHLFEVDCTTLDDTAHLFTEHRISLLKIDVEGREAEVLAGASRLLAEQRVDCLYVEAGMNPDGVQQCYLRRIDDLLLGHGYRTFRIYEQQHEWIDDSPLLRRVNVAYFSRRFADANPYRATRELHAARLELDAAREAAQAAEAERARLQAEVADAAGRARGFEIERKRWQEERAEADAQRRALQRLESARADDQRRGDAAAGALRARVEALEAERDGLSRQAAQTGEEKRELVLQLRELHWREAGAWKAAAKAQNKLATLRGRPAFRAARAVRANLGSVGGWLRLPGAVWRELTQQAQAPAADDAQVRAFDPGSAPLSLALTVRPQRLAVRLEAGVRSLMARALLGGASGSVAVQLRVTNTLGMSTRRKVEVAAGAPVQLLELSGPDPRVEIELARAQGDFCLLVLEWSEASGDAEAAPRSAAVASEPGVADLEKKLWGGYAAPAAAALERVRADARAAASEREAAAWHLARWSYAQDDLPRALQLLEGISSERMPNRVQLARAQCLIALGRWNEADEIVRRGSRGPKALDFKLLESALARGRAIDAGRPAAEADALRLAALNEVLATGRLAPLVLRDAGAPLGLANITAQAEPAQAEPPLKVSVIVPAYNAAESIGYVIEGLLAQTWRALEIVVVDDASSDSTVEQVQRLAAADARVQLVRNPVNLGAYRTRNAGASAATGDLLTVHDSDDWSHPQKIERQVEALLAHPRAVAVVSSWVRVDAQLGVVGPWLPKGTLYDVNFSSLLLRRSVLEAIGPWDEVQVSGDAEFYFRIQAVYGEDAVHKLPPAQLLSFSLSRPDSLTRSKATHISSLTYGLRWNYRDAFRHWHARLQRDDTQLPLDAASARGRFPVPIGNSARRAAEYRYDLVVISDFAMRGGAFVSSLNYVVAAAQSGLKVAVFHWRKYSLAAAAPLQPRLYDACIEHGVDLLSPGDNVQADTVLFGYPVILTHAIEPMPKIATQRVLVIVNQFASRLVDGQDPQYDPQDLRRRLHALFNVEATWIPISAWVLRLMKADARYPAPYPQPWNPMIDVEAWCTGEPRWRGAERRRPVVGRHGRDAYTKWPSRAADLRAAYGVGQDWDVRFLGGANHAIGMLGSKPANWTVTPFDGATAQDFLRDLDFYLHYPHELYIEEFGRAVMEAMAIGVPCVLPPQFAETFGSAAAYAPPDQAARTLAELWSSRERYLEQARAGRAFVLAHCDSRGFAERLRRLVEAGAPEPRIPALQE